MGNKNKYMFLIIFVIVVVSVAVVSLINIYQKQQVSSVDSNRPSAAEKGETIEVPSNVDLKILKREVSDKAKFYPYKAGETYMELLAVKATDGSIRTALNTCLVCFDSGQGYYKQQGDKLICQNCGNVVGIDDIGIAKNGCNPVPIFPENKTDDSEYITVRKEFLEASKDLFADWER